MMHFTMHTLSDVLYTALTMLVMVAILWLGWANEECSDYSRSDWNPYGDSDPIESKEAGEIL